MKLKEIELKEILNDIRKIKIVAASLEEKILKLLEKEKEEKTKKEMSNKKLKNELEEEKLKQEWIELQKKIEKSSEPQNIIENFVKNNTKNYLKAFIKANNLNIDPKLSKENIAKNLLQLVKITKVITTGKPI